MLTPDEARALIEQHGSIAAAARVVGVAHSTFSYWLDPEPTRRRMRRLRRDPAFSARELDRQIERYENLPNDEYRKRLHQMRMAHIRRRIRAFKQRQEA